ncbi:FeoB-associated Cys-rich membrane protein [Saccharibacillus qingshengii]|uniref:FeoB-associated Cys-rich membrane protein n=1 Tax=Saccharibacillus qingshengii TaxID=1763540 RepID=UPI001C12E89A|nr:FeoB-associated Cys-rich membrane protein [Saccharibacillus qingshengii]
MINWIIIGLALIYSGYVLVRFWNKSKKGACSGCTIQSDGRTPAGCPGCITGLPDEALDALKKNSQRRRADRN